jgi:hypothetical protein
MKFIILFFSSLNLFAYVDMSDASSRASDLNMTLQDYSFAMAIAGLLSGAIFGLFVWKIK